MYLPQYGDRDDTSMENRQLKVTNKCHVAMPWREAKQAIVLGLLEGEQKQSGTSSLFCVSLKMT